MDLEFIDSHTHLHTHTDKEGFKNALLEAKNNHISHLINLFDWSDYHLFQEFRDLENTNHKFALGVHPNEVIKFYDQMENIYKIFTITQPSIIGETGLDLFKSTNKQQQLEFLKMHIDLSIKYNKPLVIHARECDIQAILQLIKNVPRVIFHCFTFGISEMLEIIKLPNTLISFSGIITFKKSETLREVVKLCPIERLLCETDSPFLTPEPFRSKPNHSKYVSLVYEKVSEIKNINMIQLQQQIYQNMQGIFI